jgi:hypothetical protein
MEARRRAKAVEKATQLRYTSVGERVRAVQLYELVSLEE